MEMVTGLAHDLRSPLTSIMLLAEALQLGQAGPVNEVQSQHLESIFNTASSLCATASQVLELAGSGSRLLDRPAPFSVANVLTSVGDVVLPIAQEKGLEIRLAHQGADRRIGHGVALWRVLLNLATNAVKFTDAGFVEIAAKPIHGTRLAFSVRDTASLIAPAASDTVPLPRRKALPGRRHDFPSYGLGLKICRKLLRGMGTDLARQTQLGSGTRFSFELELPVAAPPR